MQEKTRQFIFRVWNITEKKFVMTGSLYACEGIASLSQPFNRNTHTIQQYTGINDVEDNPIYEGDIISLDLFDTKKRAFSPFGRIIS